MQNQTRNLAIVALTALAGYVFVGAAYPAEEIDRAVEAVKAVIRSGNRQPMDEAHMQRLELAIAEGEKASERLRKEITDLEREKNELERVQTILASGLIGVLVTAVVAVLGALSSRGRSKAERDLKRLEVLEKARNLQKSGIDIPADIIRDYHAFPTSESVTATGAAQP
jgi:hypothetical protein